MCQIIGKDTIETEILSYLLPQSHIINKNSIVEYLKIEGYTCVNNKILNDESEDFYRELFILFLLSAIGVWSEERDETGSLAARSGADGNTGLFADTGT